MSIIQSFLHSALIQVDDLILVFFREFSIKFKFLSDGEKITCILRRQFDETRMICENLFPYQIAKESTMGRLLRTLEFCCFNTGTKIILRELSDRNDLEWKIYLYDIYSFVASLIITLKFHFTLYLIQTEWSKKLEKRKGIYAI